jgi:nicotinate-nucleotide adenylyltransferase
MPAPEPGERWGILGGAFDPLHFGHLTLAREIRNKVKLDGVLLVPTLEPPHRPQQPVVRFEDRVTMLELALKGEAAMAVSRIEETTSRPSYTLDTVRALKKKYPQVEFVFIIGADIVSQFKSWHCWQDLLREIKLIVGYRRGADLSELSAYPEDRFTLVETTPVDLSSTQVRERIRMGATREQLSKMVPPSVADFILRRRLYL